MMNKDFIKIGNVKIERTAALAPMAGVSDRAFRELSKMYGASYVITEMVSAKAVCFGDKKTQKLLSITENQRPIAIQLFGFEPEYIAKAAYILLKYKPDIIDINMGCPVKKITSNNSGSALMKDPRLVFEIIKATTKAVDVPVTIKIRSGFDNDNVNAVKIAKVAQEAGASAVTVHGRTKEQMYLGKASLEVIKQVKAAVNIPVIGNGDVTNAESASKMYLETGCDLVMVGRGALGAPWIFKEISSYIKDGILIAKPSLIERINVMKYHINLMLKYEPETIAMKEARKHINWYLKGFKNAATIRGTVSTVNTLGELENILNYYLDIN